MIRRVVAFAVVATAFALAVTHPAARHAEEESPRLTLFATADKEVLGVSNGRLMLMQGTDPRYYAMTVYDLDTGNAVVDSFQFPVTTFSWAMTARLLSSGRVFSQRQQGLFQGVFGPDFGAGLQGVPFLNLNDPTTLIQTAGEFGLWRSGDFEHPSLSVRNFTTGTSGGTSIDWGLQRYQLAGNGDIVVEDCSSSLAGVHCSEGVQKRSFWWRFATGEQVIVHTGVSVGLISDGINALYTLGGQVLRYRPEGPEVLASASGQQSYDAAGGWMAFVDRDANGINQVWRRSPEGVQSQVSTGTSAAQLDGLGDTGELMFVSDGRRFFSATNRPPLDVGPAVGQPHWAGNQWVVFIGKSVYKLDTDDRARLVAPTTTLATPEVVFRWKPAIGATAYWLDIGTAPAGTVVHSASEGLATARTVRVPLTGQPLYARLWTLIDGEWRYLDSTLATVDGRATFTAPLPTPATIATRPVAFEWTAGLGAIAYWLDLGSTPGGNDLYARGSGLAATSLVDGLPADGRTIYARLWTQQHAVWSYVDATFTLADAHGGALLSGPMQATLPSDQALFTWRAVPGATVYWLDVGLTPGGAEFYPDTSFSPHLLSATVRGLPVQPTPVHARLWSLVGGAWAFQDYAFAAGHAERTAVLRTPVVGDTLADDTVGFSWTPVPDATVYWLDVGRAQGRGDLFAAALRTAAASVGNLPMTGEPLFVRLWTLVANQWRYTDYVFATRDPDGGAVLQQPPRGVALAAREITLTWSAAEPGGEMPPAYWLDAGTSPGESNLFSGPVPTRTAQLQLPLDGGVLFTRLWTLRAGHWIARDFQHAIANARDGAVLLTPAPGATLRDATVVFEWQMPQSTAALWLDVGTVPGGSDLYSAAQARASSVTITGLPTDGRRLYVRMWSLLDDGTTRRWTYGDSVYLTGAPPSTRPER